MLPATAGPNPAAIARRQSSAFTAMKKLIGSLLAMLVVASAWGADTVIYAEDPRVDFILMKLRAAGTGKPLREIASEEFRSELSIPDGRVGRKRLAPFVDDFDAQAEAVDPAAVTVRRHVKLAIDHYDKEAGRFVFRNATDGVELNEEIDYCALFPESFTGRRPTASSEANLGLTVNGQTFSFMFPIARELAQKWMHYFDESGLRRVGTMRYFEADFDYRLVGYKHDGAGSDRFLAEMRRMVLIDPVVSQVILAIDWEGGALQDIADSMPDDYSAAEQQARSAIPKQHKHNVPIPGPIG
jgi:hypothetical protein